MTNQSVFDNAASTIRMLAVRAARRSAPTATLARGGRALFQGVDECAHVARHELIKVGAAWRSIAGARPVELVRGHSAAIFRDGPGSSPVLQPAMKLKTDHPVRHQPLERQHAHQGLPDGFETGRPQPRAMRRGACDRQDAALPDALLPPATDPEPTSPEASYCPQVIITALIAPRPQPGLFTVSGCADRSAIARNNPAARSCHNSAARRTG